MDSASSNDSLDERQRKSAQEAFQKLKPTCVALLGKSALSPSTIPSTLALLTTLHDTLNSLKPSRDFLTPSLIQYVFFPLSTILRRNPGSAVPDQVFEKILRIFAILCEEWWWTCEIEAWEQIWMLAGSVLIEGGGRAGKGKGKDRDDETKEAAVTCLVALLRNRSLDIESTESSHYVAAPDRFQLLRRRALEPGTLNILGQTLSSLLETSMSSHLPLQLQSLHLLHIIIFSYFEANHVPSFLPGTVSTMCKIALGEGRHSYQRGEVVQAALRVLSISIVKGIGNDVCREAGLIRKISGLEDFQDFATSAIPTTNGTTAHSVYAPSPFFVPRTESWHRATASQLHLAINTLTPLSEHPNSVALIALSELSWTLMSSCNESLPTIAPILLSNLLTLSASSYPDVHSSALTGLAAVLPTSTSLRSLLLQTTYSNLSALPRILPSGVDRKIRHLSGQIEAVCHLSSEKHLSSIASGVGRLLGSNGGIEKWGLGLLHSVDFVAPSVAPHASAVRLLMNAQQDAFPQFMLRNVTSVNTMAALERMMRSLGTAGREDALYAVEWFVEVARRSRDTQAVAALWCSTRLLEGVGRVVLGVETASPARPSGRVVKVCKWIARSISDLWDENDLPETSLPRPTGDEDSLMPLEHVKGVSYIENMLKLDKHITPHSRPQRDPSITHVALSLQLLAVTGQILSTSFTPLFLQVLYPILHSLVSPIPSVSSTALCTLQVITQSTGYASPANLLLSNFDYALDSVSRRLTKTKLDLQATKVLVVLGRVVGKDVVDRAGDVVEECFDRLDEFHGYSVVVEGLMEVLSEVVSILEAEEISAPPGKKMECTWREDTSSAGFRTFIDWYQHRNEEQSKDGDDDFGPTPHVPWGDPEQDKTTTEPEPCEEDTAAPPSPSQALINQIVGRSLYFLTHSSALIRARVISLLSASVPLLHESELLPHVSTAWPFILNRLADTEPFVVLEATLFIQRLVEHVGDFMTGRLWDDVWPRFKRMLDTLSEADSKSALARRGKSSVGTESAYTTSHRLYKSMLSTMREAVLGVHLKDHHTWEVGLSFLRFLHRNAHEELQLNGRLLFLALGQNNADAVWLLLCGTIGEDPIDVEANTFPKFLMVKRWDIVANAKVVLESLR